MPVVVVRENIISLHADAVVNPATPSLTAGEGISAEIFAAAGQRKLAAACKQIGYCETGCSVITKVCGQIRLPAGSVFGDCASGDLRFSGAP